MAIITSDHDLTKLRQSGAILAAAMARVMVAAKAGVTTIELDAIAEQAIRGRGGRPSFLGFQDYPASLCVSINDQVVHGIPSQTTKLADGDLVGLDLGVDYEGFFTDHAVTVGVGRVGKDAQKLLDATAQALTIAIAAIKPGRHIGDIGAAVEASIRPYGYGIIRQLTGHGVGRAVHEAPSIPNVGQAGKGPEIVEGMVLAIEPMIAAGDWHVVTLDDGWTVATADHRLAAHFEHTVLVTATGAEIITKQ